MLALFGYGIALLLPPSAPFAAAALPAIVGEGLSRWGLRRWPRLAVLAGGLMAGVQVAIITFTVSLCGLSDEPGEICERTTEVAEPLAWAFGSVTVALTVLAVAWPLRRAVRWALWSMPPVMTVTILAIGTL